MKIGITCYPTYGGSGVVATELGMELAARGHEVHFISYAPPARLTASERITFHEVEVSNYPLFDHAPYALTLAVKMLEVAESARLDLLHVHYAIPHSVSALLARAMAAPPRRLPFITTLHGTDITLVGNDRSFLPITRFSIEQSDGVTCISNYLKKKTIEEFDIKRPIEVIPNFVNCEIYCRKEDLGMRAQWAPNGEPILMHLSNFRPVKRVTDVVEIFDLVRRKMPAKLVLIGDGPDRGAVEWTIRRKGLTKDVFLLGKQDRVYEKLSVADLFLLPSDLESFGLAALEAMACEVPVIGTMAGGMPDVVEHGVDGYLVEPRDVVSAGRYAVEILARADRGREMGLRAREDARRRFCAEDIIPHYEDYYRRVLETAVRAGA